MGAIVVRQEGFERQSVIPCAVEGPFQPPPSVETVKARSKAKVDPWDAAKAKMDARMESEKPLWTVRRPVDLSDTKFVPVPTSRESAELQERKDALVRDAAKSRDLNVIRKRLQGVGMLDCVKGLWTLVTPSRTYSARTLPELQDAVVL